MIPYGQSRIKNARGWSPDHDHYEQIINAATLVMVAVLILVCRCVGLL